LRGFYFPLLKREEKAVQENDKKADENFERLDSLSKIKTNQ
jgi:hypothetical protein